MGLFPVLASKIFFSIPRPYKPQAKPAELRMKVAVVMLATALANIVFPVPGGP